MKEFITMLKFNVHGFSMAQLILCLYTIMLNLICYGLMGYDKLHAKKKKKRIRESTFMILSWLGGSVGVLIGMIIFSHKTKKTRFRIGIPIIYILTRIVGIIIMVYLTPIDF